MSKHTIGGRRSPQSLNGQLNYFLDRSMEYEAVIGLEVHVQLKTRTKMFCGCANRYGDEPNQNTCPICLGYPGALPSPNKEAIVKTILAGRMLKCEIPDYSEFDRKNYFYPDMPKNYQTSQLHHPLCDKGEVALHKYAFPKESQENPEASLNKVVHLNHIHLEEDVAKSTHYDDHSRIDFNRAGTPLMEIVTEAEINSADEAYAFLKSLQQILIYGDVSDADMEKGQLRCDVNISVRPKGETKLGTKCEVKNMNSISGVRRALVHEIARQIEIVSSGGSITQETRRWNDALGETTVMRSKEDAHDYRYFTCPDLMGFQTRPSLFEEAGKRLPELPQEKKSRFMDSLDLSEYQAEVLASDRRLADYFEEALSKTKESVSVANYIINDFLATEPDLDSPKIPAQQFAELAELVKVGTISSKQAKQVMTYMFEEGGSPKDIVKAKGLVQISDTSSLEPLCQEAIDKNPKSVEDFRSGKKAAVNALKGYVMKQTKGKANPQLVDEILLRLLG
ncbi:MAG: Asp-tRNA(Asn)/Glu-tRNA(Gln) amidotransferase subunit GatB [Verrucomicrobiota bacterium]